jgi:AAA15 family ATPase/GTPase
MILRFEVENFRSFRHPVVLLLAAGSERRHSGRLPSAPKSRARILPACAVFGPNAGGKSNLIAALALLRKLVVAGTTAEQLIPRQPFKFENDQPTRLTLDFLAPDDRIYCYSLAFSDERITKESLSRVSGTEETTIFSRSNGANRFDLSGLGNMARDDMRRAFFRFTAEGTRPNQPFLHEAMDRAIGELRPVFQWFSSLLTIIGPESSPFVLEDMALADESFRGFLRDRLRGADTGIETIETDDQPLDEFDDIPETIRAKIRARFKKGDVLLLRTGPNHAQRILIRHGNGELRACRLRAVHRLPNGKTAAFEADEESDGTRRYMDLSLAFYALHANRSRSVILIDELDRSLHPVLCRAALEAFLTGCSKDSRSQLLFTTHDASLMTPELFRREELWILEKSPDGESDLFSLAEIPEEYRKFYSGAALRRNYLQGRFGGIPVVTRHSTADNGPK